MTTATKARAVSPATITSLTSDDTLPKFTGNTAMARRNAFYCIAPNAHAEGIARAAALTNFKAAIGAPPKGYNVAKPDTAVRSHLAFSTTLHAARIEWLAGRATARMPAGEFPKDCTDAIAKIDHVRALICAYASPDAKKIAHGQSGRRSVVQHKVIRAAEQALSVFLAELELSAATKQSETSKKTRSTRAKATRGNAAQSKEATPSHSALVAADKPTTADDAHAFLDRQSIMLADYAKKNAKLICTDYGAAVVAFQTALIAAGKARDARKAAKEAGAHNAK